MKLQGTPDLARIIKTRLELLRANRPETQKEIAAAAGIPLSTLNAAVLGKSTPHTDAVIKIARYYRVSVDWIVGESDVMRPASVKQSRRKQAVA